MLVGLHRNQQAFQKSISEHNTQKNSSLTSKKDQKYELVCHVYSFEYHYQCRNLIQQMIVYKSTLRIQHPTEIFL